MKYFFTLLLALGTHSKIIHNLCGKPHQQLLLTYLKETAPTNNYFLLQLTGTNKQATKDIANDFIKTLKQPMVIVNEKFSHESDQLGQIQMLYSFVPSVKKMESFLGHLNKLQFWYVKPCIQIIICTPVSSYQWLNIYLNKIWKMRLLYFVIAYVFNGKVEAVSFNPFNQTILNHTGNFNNDLLFADKLKSLYGYTLKIAMFHDPPRVILENGNFRGRNIIKLKNFARIINARISYVVSNKSYNAFQVAWDDIRGGEADFSFMGYFRFVSLPEARYSYPHEMDNIAIMAPRGKMVPQYMNMALTFQTTLWKTLILVNAIIIIFFALMHKFKKLEFEVFELVAALFGVPITVLERKRWHVKVMMLSLIIGFGILSCAFQSALTSALVTPKYYKNIDTLEELKESGIPIYIPAPLKAQLPTDNILQDKIILDVRENIFKRIEMGQQNAAFALPLSYSKRIMDVEVRNGKTRLRFLKQHLIPGYGVHIFPRRSPYTRKVEEYIRLDSEYGLSYYRSDDHITSINVFQKRLKDEGHTTVLTLNHLQTAFYLLFLGYLVGIFICAAEIIITKIYNE